MKEIYAFLRELAQNNNREWFNANKERYRSIQARIAEITTRLIAALATVDSEAAVLSPDKCLYRIYRDTRFSHDKTPLKTHIGIFLNPPYGKKSPTGGYYLHIEPDNTFFAAGQVCLPSPVLKALRRDIFDNIDEYRAIVEAPSFRKAFPSLGDNLLKTAPKGFPKDWPHIAYLRPRDYVASTARFDESRLSAGTIHNMHLPLFAEAKPFLDFINATLADYSPDEA